MFAFFSFIKKKIYSMKFKALFEKFLAFNMHSRKIITNVREGRKKKLIGVKNLNGLWLKRII